MYGERTQKTRRNIFITKTRKLSGECLGNGEWKSDITIKLLDDAERQVVDGEAGLLRLCDGTCGTVGFVVI